MAAQGTSNEAVNDSTTAKSEKMVKQASKRLNRLKFSPSLHQDVHPVVVPVSLCTLPIYIDVLWKTMEDTGGEPFKKINLVENKNIFKKVMLILAEAKICSAQQGLLQVPDEGLPQKTLYFRQELEDLSSSFKELPYPLAIYFDCLGNTNEGKLSVTPILAKTTNIICEWRDAISYGPRQLLPLLRLLKVGTYNTTSQLMAAKLRYFPNFVLQQISGHYLLSTNSSSFWLTSQGNIALSDYEIKLSQEIIKCLNNLYLNIPVDLLKGKGSMAQTVQTPQWSMEDIFRYFCMTDIPEVDQKLGAIFGFSFTFGDTVQKSRYDGCYETAHWRGEVLPRRILKYILDEEQVGEVKTVDS